jgi:hypothetical protein
MLEGSLGDRKVLTIDSKQISFTTQQIELLLGGARNGIQQHGSVLTALDAPIGNIHV